MATTRKLLMLSHRAFAVTRSSVATISDSTANQMIHDHVAGQLKRLDPRFLKYNSPHPTQTDHTSILTYPETRVTTLPNGLRVATESNLASHRATVCVWVDAGSRFETEETNGVAHFLEHMAFAGTPKRSGSDLFEEAEKMGAQLSGYTSRDQTVYIVKVMTGDVPKAIDILSDMLQNSSFDEKLIWNERSEIFEEYLETMAKPMDVIYDRLHAAAFQHTSFGRTILGTPKNILTMTKDVVQDYFSTPLCCPQNASGAVNHEDIVEQVNKLFTKLSTNPITTTQLIENEPAIFTGSEIRERDDEKPLAHFAIAFKGASRTDPDLIALLVIQSLLGSWSKTSEFVKPMGSLLAQKVGTDEIAESVTAASYNHEDTGLFLVYAVAEPDCLEDLASAIMQEISKLCYQVRDYDVILAQNRLKSSWLREGVNFAAEEMGQQMLNYGRRIPHAELFARIDAVDVATVKRVANRFFFDQEIAIAASGPVKLLPDYNWFRSHTCGMSRA